MTIFKKCKENWLSPAKKTVAKYKRQYLKGIRFTNHAMNTNEDVEKYRHNYENIDWSIKK